MIIAYLEDLGIGKKELELLIEFSGGDIGY
jgi:hypothetical protein